jgi:hypothetical protein
MSSPTQRSLDYLRKNGAIAGIVERYNQYSRKRNDLFGFIDIVAIQLDHTILGVQCTSASNHAARVAKILSAECNDAALRWLLAGAQLQVMSWSKRITKKKDGSKAKVGRWTVRIEPMTLIRLKIATSVSSYSSVLNEK